jgi:DNA-binding transcriptional LysR family regulator
MNRFAHRLFGDDLPATRHATDGAEMGKLLVAQGLGLCLLPDFSVVGDPLERAGLIVARPLADADSPAVRMVLLGRRADSVPDQVRSLARELARKAAAYRPAAQSSG